MKYPLVHAGLSFAAPAALLVAALEAALPLDLSIALLIGGALFVLASAIAVKGSWRRRY